MMIKGFNIENSFSDKTYLPYLNTGQTLSSSQDSLSRKNVISSQILQIAKPQNLALDTGKVERIFRASEQREINIQKPKKLITFVPVSRDSNAFIGSDTRIYYDGTPSYQKEDYNPQNLNINFLQNIAEKNIDIHYKDTLLHKSTTRTHQVVVHPEIPQGFEGNLRVSGINDWYVFLALIALTIFAWGKNFYQKYLNQIISSSYNYQNSIQLYRDKNVLFRNLSFILQILFPVNLGLFFFFLLDYYHMGSPTHLAVLDLLFFSVGIFLFFRIKAAIYKFLGLLFKVQEDFQEIQHHMNIFVQTAGVVLLPFVVTMPFLGNPLKLAFLFTLLGILGIIGLLFCVRGIQIVNRKQVSFFFLILYLCAVEILPVALVVKVSYTII